MSTENMTKEELEFTIAKKLEEIRDLYYEAYPRGNYLALTVSKKINDVQQCLLEQGQKVQSELFQRFRKGM